MALIKTRNQYYEELGSKFSLEDELLKRMGDTDENINIAKELLNDDTIVLNESAHNNDVISKDDLVMNLANKNDGVKEDNTNFYSLIDNYENNEEENAVISTDELERTLTLKRRMLLRLKVILRKNNFLKYLKILEQVCQQKYEKIYD